MYILKMTSDSYGEEQFRYRSFREAVSGFERITKKALSTKKLHNTERWFTIQKEGA